MKLTNTRRMVGNNGEQETARWLSSQGFRIYERNYRTRQGEIDIIAEKDNTVCFIEVKARRHNYFHLSELITPTKQHKIVQTAIHYIATQPHIIDKIYRFDVALVEGNVPDLHITYIPHAFNAPD